MNQKKTLDLVYMAFYIALSVCLSYLNKIFPIIQMQNGGSLEYSLVALLIASYHLGWKKGTLVALLSYIVETMFGFHSYMLNPMQVCFDYIFPICIMGMVSAIPKPFKKSEANIVFGIVVVMLLKYLSHVTSGALFYASYNNLANGSLAGWIFSFGYNATYCIPTAVLAIVLVPLLVTKIKNAKKDVITGI